jgi:hypothetical protein
MKYFNRSILGLALSCYGIWASKLSYEIYLPSGKLVTRLEGPLSKEEIHGSVSKHFSDPFKLAYGNKLLEDISVEEMSKEGNVILQMVLSNNSKNPEYFTGKSGVVAIMRVNMEIIEVAEPVFVGFAQIDSEKLLTEGDFYQFFADFIGCPAFAVNSYCEVTLDGRTLWLKYPKELAKIRDSIDKVSINPENIKEITKICQKAESDPGEAGQLHKFMPVFTLEENSNHRLT